MPLHPSLAQALGSFSSMPVWGTHISVSHLAQRNRALVSLGLGTVAFLTMPSTAMRRPRCFALMSRTSTLASLGSSVMRRLIFAPGSQSPGRKSLITDSPMDRHLSGCSSRSVASAGSRRSISG